MIFKKQVEFPLLEQYQKIFNINEFTIFAYDDSIYCNYPLPPDLIVHEKTHLKQQKKVGLDEWVRLFLTNEEFRLKQEVEAYLNQLDSIKDRELRLRIRMESAQNLSSSLYGSIINYEDAYNLLK